MKKVSEYNRLLSSGWSRALIFAGILFVNLMMTVPSKDVKENKYQKNHARETSASYGIVPTEDKAINPDIERKMYKRSGTKITEIKGSHVIFMSQPSAVADVIVNASEQK